MVDYVTGSDAGVQSPPQGGDGSGPAGPAVKGNGNMQDSRMSGNCLDGALRSTSSSNTGYKTLGLHFFRKLKKQRAKREDEKARSVRYL